MQSNDLVRKLQICAEKNRYRPSKTPGWNRWAEFQIDIHSPTRLLVFVCVAAAGCVTAQTLSTAPPNEVIIAQMEQAQAENPPHDRPYVVTRDYKLFRQKPTLNSNRASLLQ